MSSKKKPRMSKHHRKPCSLGGTTCEDNISNVNIVQHTAWHILFYNLDAESICQTINRTWLDPEYKFLCVKRGKKEENQQLEFDFSEKKVWYDN